MDRMFPTGYHKHVLRKVGETRKPARYSALNAIEQLRVAWRMRKISPKMAFFVAFTAEEEATTALFLSLNRRGYRGAKNLRSTNHLHKASVPVYLDAIALAFRKIKPKGVKLTLRVHEGFTPHGLVAIIARPKSPKMIERFRIDHPLEFSSQLDGRSDDFLDAVASIAKAKTAKAVRRHLRDRIKQRNLALYATSRSVPRFEGDIVGHLEAMRDAIFRIVTIFVIIDLEPKKQSFAQQALDGFLNLLRLAEGKTNELAINGTS